MPALLNVRFSRFGRVPFGAGSGPATPVGVGRSLLMVLVAAIGLLVLLPILIVGGLLLAVIALVASLILSIVLRLRHAWRRFGPGARSDDSGRENVRVVRTHERGADRVGL